MNFCCLTDMELQLFGGANGLEPIKMEVVV